MAVKELPTNRIGEVKTSYEGGTSTLCIGCGHDQVTRGVIESCYEMGIEPHMVAKLSGIGCSSKTPAYFLNRSWGFNSVHGRMPCIATGVELANKHLLNIGVSGDGDTASIGFSHFCHMVRRNTQCVYLVENNGVYGLTKGQFSATADLGSQLKSGKLNHQAPINLCAIAIQLGCGFVARTFSGAKQQMQETLKAAMAYPGTAFLDIISPCVTFNNHEGSTKSYPYTKDHNEILNVYGFVPAYDDIEAELEAGETKDVKLPDGSSLRFSALHRDHDPSDKLHALSVLDDSDKKGEVLTGIFYLDPNRVPHKETLNTVDAALAHLPDSQVRPADSVMKEIMANL